MFEAWGRALYRRRRLTLGLTLVLAAFAGRPDGGHRGADRCGLGRHGRGRADQPDAVPRGLPALHGLRRGGHRRGGHAGRADRAARAARRPRPPGQRAAHPPLGAVSNRGAGPDQASTDETSGAWYRLAHSVMRRPAVYATVIVIGLLALGAPFLRISWGGTDARTLPAASTVGQVSQTLASDFPVNSADPIEALVTLPRTSGAATALDAYLHRIQAIPGVTGAQVTGAKAGAVRVDIGYAPATVSSAARHIVTQIRDTSPPPGAAVLVGGTTAGLVDELASLGATLPPMALLVGVSTFVLLFLAFGSVVLPVKAIVMNVLSLSATFGVVVWIFQWGHLSGLLRFTPTGSIDPTMPILMLAVIFGLSMDYEVFHPSLPSRPSTFPAGRAVALAAARPPVGRRVQ